MRILFVLSCHNLITHLDKGHSSLHLLPFAFTLLLGFFLCLFLQALLPPVSLLPILLFLLTGVSLDLTTRPGKTE